MPSLRDQLEAAEVGSVAFSNWGNYIKRDSPDYCWVKGRTVCTSAQLAFPGQGTTHIIPPDVLAACRVEVQDAAE